jgi:hypothetical protein
VAEQTDEERIFENALAPQQASNDSGSVTQHPIDKQIEALRLKQGAAARNARRNPFRLLKFSPPGMND